MTKVNCPGCKKQYNIPDEKIPAGKELDLPCPACKTIMKIKAGVAPEKKETDAQTPSGKELMKKIIKTSKALPPMPQIMAKATEVMSNDNAGFKEVGDVLETDQAMATRVLKLANSAYYGLSVPVSSVQQASALLGFQALLELITVVSTSKMMGKSLEGYEIDAKEVWTHSLSVAMGAKFIAEKKFPSLVNDAFNAGLIHDSGMLILDSYISKKKGVFDSYLTDGKTIQGAEKEMFGFDHAEIASVFFQKWNLPSAQTSAILYHHAPSTSNGDKLSYILHAADYIVMKEKTERHYEIEEGAMNFLGLNEEEVEAISAEIKESVDNIIQSMGG